MSTDFYLVSEAEAIWVAQDGMSGFTFYRGEPKCMEALDGFLERNQGKTIRFLPAHEVDDAIDAGQIKEIIWYGAEDGEDKA
jgi:hypothetical protein